MTRSEIIDLVVVRTPETTRGGHQHLRRMLEAKSTQELEQIHHQILLEAADDRVIQAQAERAADRALHEHYMKQHHDQAREAQLKRTETQDRETFAEACREYNIGNIEANFRLIRDTLGPNFNLYQVGQAMTSGAVGVSPATEQEQEQWRQEAQEDREDFLVNRATPQELRTTAKAETEQRRIEAQRVEAERQIAVREVADAAYGFPPLPEFNQHGGKIDAAYLNKISNTNLQLFRNLMRKHGAANLTARLRGIR